MLALRRTLKPPSAVATIRRFLTTVDLPDPPTSAAYDDLITAAGRERDFAAVHRLLNQRYVHGCFTTKNTFKFISSDLSDLDDLLKMLSDLNEGHCRKTAYDSLIARLCKMQLMDAALRVAGELIRGKYGADADTFHPILSALTRKKCFDEAWRVIEIMREKGVARNITCYNFILTSYSVTGDLKSCIGVLRKMEEEGLKADARTYDALVLGACKVEKIDGAMAILRRMLEDGVEAMYATYAHVIGGLVRLGYCAQAVEFVISYGGVQTTTVIGLPLDQPNTLAVGYPRPYFSPDLSSTSGLHIPEDIGAMMIDEGQLIVNGTNCNFIIIQVDGSLSIR